MNAKKLGLLVALSAVIGSALSASGTIAYSYQAGSYANATGVKDMGMNFTVGSTPVFVTALGAWDNGQNGISGNVTVAIYKVITDQTLEAVSGASAAFAGTSGTVIDGTRWQSITPVTLAANTTYRLVASGYGGVFETYYENPNSGQSSYLSANDGGGVLTFGASWQRWPGDYWEQAVSGRGTPQWTAGSFDFTPVPEASQFAVAGVGLLGLVYIGRCAWQRRKGVA